MLIKNESGLSTFAIIGFSFLGIIAIAAGLRFASGQGFERSTHNSVTGQRVSGSSSRASTGSAQVPAGANAGQLAPDFTLTSLDGQQISLSDYRGHTPVVLDFFATWCPNCRRDMPKQQALYDKYSGDIEVIAINLNESQKTVEKFVAKLGLTHPVAMDPSGRTARIYAVNYTNTHIYIDINGVIQKTQYSDATDANFKALLN